MTEEEEQQYCKGQERLAHTESTLEERISALEAILRWKTDLCTEKKDSL